MNEALLSSKKLDWCTPADFFAELDREFHFNLDPAATDKSAKCARYFTPADNAPKLCSALYNAFDGEPDTPLEVMKRYKDKAIVFIPKRDTWTW